MQASQRPGRKGRRWLPIAIGGVVALAVMVYASLTAGSTDSKAHLEHFVAQQLEHDAQPRVREIALYGDVDDGVAFDEYLSTQSLAMSAARRLQSLDETPGEQVEEHRRTELAAIRSEAQPAFAAMRRGAHARIVGRDRSCPLPARWLELLIVECDAMLEAGRSLDAVHTWLDTLAFAIDAGRTMRLLDTRSMPELARSLCEFWSAQRLERLTPEALTALRTGIERAEPVLAEPVSMRRMLAVWAQWFLGDTFQSARFSFGSYLDAWQHGFSPQRAAIDQMVQAIEQVSLLEPPAASWTRRRAQFERFEATCAAPQYDLWTADYEHRGALAALRLLMLELRMRCDLPLGDVPDPFGDGPIVVRDEGTRTVLRSESTWPGTSRERVVDK